MAWTAPMTAVAGSVFTAAQFNTFVRDNLLETPSAKATTPGSFFTTTSAGSIAERIPNRSLIATSETTSSTSYADLATVGPQVSCITGTSALICVTSRINVATVNTGGQAGVDISGATTEAASDTHCLRSDTPGTGNSNRMTAVRFHTTLTPGTNVFKMQYKVAAAATATYAAREIVVIPF
jgi:hypothetical protein